MTLLYEGKAKSVYKTDDEEVLSIVYKDEVTAGNGKKQDVMSDKGRLNNLISAGIFERLHALNIPSHFIEKTNDTTQRVKKATIIPLEVVVRNIAAGSIVQRLGFTHGEALEVPLIELYLREMH